MIERIHPLIASIPLTKTAPAQIYAKEMDEQLFIKLKAGGYEGWGEILAAAANTREPYIALVNRIGNNLLGRNESEVEHIWELMRKMTFAGGYGIATGAISGIDIALWDIAGKKRKLPICKILGGQRPVKRYASLSRYKDIFDLKVVISKLLDSGYRMMKLHQPPGETLEHVKVIRKELGYDFELAVDLNCGFRYQAARNFVRKVQRFELKWVEEPVWPPDDYHSLKKLNKLGPVAAGENFFSVFEYKRLLEDDALSYYQPDVTKIGGITAVIELLTLFRRYGVLVAFHNRPLNGWIGITASSHLASATDLDCVIETPPNELPTGYFGFSGTINTKTIVVGGPGLGISPKEPLPQSRGRRWNLTRIRALTKLTRQ
ncbi:MAG TPA: mandelate racemase/muconate lactonizing enzyme family protein [Candidatus Bathyarchaeia archaeon]|nr:mandelate racemase/muconate lactonizing enzyme family protein [Candidatus Bathyarchaeia archaeon]